MSSSILVEQYSEKAIVVRGNTIPYKEKLLSIGGKWNKMLKGGEGWIFPLTKKPIVEKILSEPPSVYENDNSDTNSDQSDNSSAKTYKSTQRSMKSYESTSSEIILTKKEYLHLISRIERLEQIVAKFDDKESYSTTSKSSKPSKSSSKNLPLLSSINDEDINEPEYEEEERESVQPLLRKKKKNI